MSDLILVESVNSVISNINEDNESYKSDKTYNIDYDINERLRFLQDKYKDYEFKIIKNILKQRKKGTINFRPCCINFDCKTNASFCKITVTKPTHCKNCSVLSGEEMVDIKHKNLKCIKCNEKQPNFCKIDETKPTHCSFCAKIISEEENIEMININAKNLKCILCNETRASYCKVGETKATHCSPCAQIVSNQENINMEDIKHKSERCINIIDGIQCKTIAQYKKYDGYCFKCYFKINPTKIPIINRKIKEDAVVEFIKLIYTQEIIEKLNIKDIRFDRECGTTKKKPDIVIICENNVIIIEVDEFQHKRGGQEGGQYSKENEENKMKLIKDYYKSQDKKIIYIRFNPDDYLSKNNIKIKSPWKEDDGILKLVDETDWKNRLEILKQKIDFYLKKKEIKNNSTNYLFYDGYKN